MANSLSWWFSHWEGIPTIKKISRKGKSLPRCSSLQTIYPIVDPGTGLLHVGGCVHHSYFSHSQRHPVILHGQHPLAKLIIQAKHVRLLHTGPTHVSFSLCRRYHIIGLRRVTNTITRACVPCRHTTVRPRLHLTPHEAAANREGNVWVGVWDYQGRLRQSGIPKNGMCM